MTQPLLFNIVTIAGIGIGAFMLIQIVSCIASKLRNARRKTERTQ